MKDVELPLALPLSWVVFDYHLFMSLVGQHFGYAGAGGLGDFVFNGLNLYDPLMIVRKLYLKEV